MAPLVDPVVRRMHDDTAHTVTAVLTTEMATADAPVR